MKPLLAALAALALVVGLTACAPTTEAPSAKSPSATAATESTAVQRFTGRGMPVDSPAAEARLDLPDGTQSVTVQFACVDEGPFRVEIGDSTATNDWPRTGICAGVRTWEIPVSTRTPPILYVRVPENVPWVAEVLASAEPVVRDAALTADCEAFAAVGSGIMNADEGLRRAVFDDVERTARVDAATAALAKALAASDSVLTGLLGDLYADIADPAQVPADAVHTASTRLIVDLCDANQSPVAFIGEFGG